MKDKDIIRLKLDHLKDNIVSKQVLIDLICDVTPDNYEITLKYLRRINKIKSIFQKYYYVLSENERKSNNLDYYSFELVFGILNKLNIKWYISLEKGLELNKVIWQSYKKFIIINNKISRKCTIQGTEFEFKKTKINYINNYNQNKTQNRITQNIGTKEKILIDFIYFNKKIPKELLDSIDTHKVKDILGNYPKSLQKKVRGVLNDF